LLFTLSKVRSAGDERHHRQVLVDQRDRPVLHLAGRVALGVDVGDLLELERALERDREVDAAAEEEEVARVLELPRQLVDLRLERERLRSPAARAPAPEQLARNFASLLLAQVEGEQVERHELGGERLGRGDADLRARRGCRARPS
jgi:hypothetical protein